LDDAGVAASGCQPRQSNPSSPSAEGSLEASPGPLSATLGNVDIVGAIEVADVEKSFAQSEAAITRCVQAAAARGHGASELVIRVHIDMDGSGTLSQVVAGPDVAAELGVSLVPTSMRALKVSGVVYRGLAGRATLLRLALASRRGDTSPVLHNFIARATA
jgi:hypothetical protein